MCWLPGLSSLWLAYMFDTRANKWCHPIDLKFLQPHWELAFGDATTGLVRRRVLAACGSMVCVSATYIKGSEVLLACNPVSKTFEGLPLVGSCTSFGACGLVHKIVDTPKASYRIFYLEFLFDPRDTTLNAASEDRCSQFHVYESIAGEWRILSRIAKGLYHEQSADRCSMVHFNDVIFVPLYEDSPTSYLANGKYVLMAYHFAARRVDGGRLRIVGIPPAGEIGGERALVASRRSFGRYLPYLEAPHSYQQLP